MMCLGRMSNLHEKTSDLRPTTAPMLQQQESRPKAARCVGVG